MSIRFAGSRTVHERRRRRLAQESDVAAATETQRVGTADTDSSGDRHASGGSFEQSPLHGLIRPQIWIHWCVVALCVSCWGGMLYVGDLAEQTDVGLRSILGIRSGRLVNFFSTIMLLWAGQLALLIYWYRRKSRNDFHGRYRLWLWIGVTLQFFLAVVATEAHLPYGEYMQRMWPLDLPQYTLLSWLVPVATIGLAMFKLLRMETQNSTCSRVLLWIAGVSGVIAGGSLIADPLLSERAGGLIQVGSATLAQLGLATSLLFHARYVIHVTNEAPKRNRKESVLRRIRSSLASMLQLSDLRFRLPSPTLSRKKTAKLDKPRAKPASSAARTKPDPKSAKSPGTSAAKSASKNAERSGESSLSAEVPKQKLRIDEAEALKGPKGPTGRIANESNEQSDQIDLDDEASLESLSKKERRRLKKQQRNASRASASAR